MAMMRFECTSRSRNSLIPGRAFLWPRASTLPGAYARWATFLCHGATPISSRQSPSTVSAWTLLHPRFAHGALRPLLLVVEEAVALPPDDFVSAARSRGIGQ